MVIFQVISKVTMCQHHYVPSLKTGSQNEDINLAEKQAEERYQATAKPSQDMKKEAAKLNRVQDQESSIIEVKKSLRYL